MTSPIGTNTDLDLGGLKLPPSRSDSERGKLDQNAFMTLMITQFRNQDPTKPLDPNEFIAQLAQFSNVSSLADMSKSVGQLSEAIYANQALQASSLIGRNVLVEGNTGQLAAGQPLAGAVELPNATNNAVIRIYNQAGELVRQMPLGPGQAGLNRFSWDGLNSSGTPAAPGQYRFAAFVRSPTGEQAVGTYSSTKVTSISLSTDLASSRITTDNGRELRLAQIKAIG